MPSTNPIYSARLKPGEIALLEEIRADAAEHKGIPISQANLLRLAIPLLRKAIPPRKAGKKA